MFRPITGIVILAAAFSLNSCSSLMSLNDPANDDSREYSGKQKLVSGEYNLNDLNESMRFYGVSDFSALDDNDKSVVVMRATLLKKEKKLNKEAYQDYIKIKGALKNDRERLQYLSLHSPVEKMNFLVEKGYIDESRSAGETVKRAISESGSGQRPAALLRGMHASDVMDMWGMPDKMTISASDNAPYTEKWVYYNFASDDGNMETRTIYFDNSEVIAWKRE